MCLPAAVVLRDVLWAKASPGLADAKVQICLRTQTSCRLETGMTGMDDCVATVTAAVAAYRRCEHRTKNINQLALVLGVTCIYGHTYNKSMDQPGKVASPARGQLNSEI